MTLNDTVADLLCRVRNAKMVRHRYVDVQYTKLNEAIVEVLRNKGYIHAFLVDENRNKMRIFLKYLKKTKESLLHGLKRISKPGRRYYVGYREIPRVFSGLGISILSTSRGVLDGKRARELKVGGELLCFVW